MDTLKLSFANTILHLLGDDKGLERLGIVRFRARADGLILLCGAPSYLKFSLFKREGRGWAVVVETTEAVTRQELEEPDLAAIKGLIEGALQAYLAPMSQSETGDS